MQGNPFEAHNSGQSSKVAIPRLSRASRTPPQLREGHKRDRVRRACKSCRKRKIRCSGDVPTCKHCQFTETVCAYEHSRRDRLTEATELNETLVSLLKDLSERVSDVDKTKIHDALGSAEDDIVSQAMETSLNQSVKGTESINEDDRKVSKDGEARVGGATGSNEGLDYLDEDLTKTRESRETGYVGHNSEVRWLRSVQRQTEHTGAEPQFLPYGPPGSGLEAVKARSDALQERRVHTEQNLRLGSMQHTTDSSFYLDSSNIDVDVVVDPYEVPDPETAEKLFDCYIETVHSSYPLVAASFEENFRRYIESLRNHRAFEIPDKWRAQMNIVFAVGAKYSHLTRAEWRGDQRDHLLYMTRAVHLLGLKDTLMVISGPDVELVRAIGALSFYFLAIGHVSRAWIMIGLAVRLALALGLHLRNEDVSLNESRKDIRVHAWWSLYSIECLLSTITGRPPSVAFEYCTVPLPSDPVAERWSSGKSPERTSYRRDDDKSSHMGNNPSEAMKSNASSERYQISRINLALISQRALLHLYSPLTATNSWESTQKKISDLLNDLEEWKLAAFSKSQLESSQYNAKFKREQFLLEIEYWSKTILVTRPCLCRLERRIRDQSDTSAIFDARSAEACCVAALEIANLCPDQPNIEFIYSNGPWWAIVHIIMQSTAVLLLEMTYKAQDDERNGPTLIPAIKKMIRWLRALRVSDLIADRAYRIIWRILKSCAPILQPEADDLLASAEEGPLGDYGPQYAQGLSPMQNASDWRLPEIPYDPFSAPQFFQQQAFGPMSDYHSEAFLGYSTHQNMEVLPFGNLFFTRFDQVTPIANMEDLLAASAHPTGFGTNTWNLNDSQNRSEPSQGQGTQGHGTQHPFQRQDRHYDRDQQPPR